MRDPTHLYEGELSPGTDRAARFISFILQPPFISVLAFLLLSTLCITVPDVIICATVCIVFSVILPMGIIIFYARKFGNRDLDVVRREDRSAPLLIGSITYLLGCGVLYLMDVPRVIWVLMLCYSVVTFAVYLVSTRWKISVHAIGCIGPSMGLAYAFGWVGLLLLITYPLVCWSRYFLKKHTPLQLIGGGVLGLLLTGLLFHLLLW